jgi:Protein of unknown function (DUF2721)
MNALLDNHLSITQLIQLILAPGVMINACGLLLLGINNKFSSVLNRIRGLNEEKRHLAVRAGGKKFPPLENQRLESLTRQLAGLMVRAKFLRNAVTCYFAAVGLFVATSLLIGADFFLQSDLLRLFVLCFFLLGMAMVFAGVVFGMRDTMKGYDVVQFEVRVDE